MKWGRDEQKGREKKVGKYKKKELEIASKE